MECCGKCFARQLLCQCTSFSAVVFEETRFESLDLPWFLKFPLASDLDRIILKRFETSEDKDASKS
jgi:hypothetical protein